jgi:general secretion pathway protein G
MRRVKKGFTLVEILVVVVIITMIAGFVVPRMWKGLGKTKRDLAKSKMAIIEDSLGRFHLDCGRLPTQDEGLQALLKAPAGTEGKWSGPYLKESQLLDPWGKEYIYVAEGEVNQGSFDLISYGADGVQGGEGDNEDIVNN